MFLKPPPPAAPPPPSSPHSSPSQAGQTFPLENHLGFFFPLNNSVFKQQRKRFLAHFEVAPMRNEGSGGQSHSTAQPGGGGAGPRACNSRHAAATRGTVMLQEGLGCPSKHPHGSPQLKQGAPPALSLAPLAPLAESSSRRPASRRLNRCKAKEDRRFDHMWSF